MTILIKIIYNTMCFAFIFDLLYLSVKCSELKYHATAAKVTTALAIGGLLIAMVYVNLTL